MNTQKSIYPLSRTFAVLCFLYLVGLCATLYLSSLSISQSSTLCELFGTDCATVALSSFGSVLGFSTASFGLGYFVCQLVFLGFLIIKPKEFSGTQLSVMPALCLNLAACISSLAFVIILFAVLKQSCFACMIVHVVNFLTFPLNFYAWKKSEARASRLVPVFISILLGIISVLVVHVVDIRYMLAVSDEQARNYLELVLNKYDQAEKYTFQREFGDAIYGEPDLAMHEIVLIYKDTCLLCAKAKKKLIGLVADHFQSIYLLTINYKNLSKSQLQEMNVDRVPAVFIDGRRAIGWEIKGFMSTFIEDCDC